MHSFIRLSSIRSLPCKLILVREYSHSGSDAVRKISVLGATGPTGQEVLKEALLQGYKVHALVRNPDKLTISHPYLVVRKVNIFKRSELSEHLEGSVAVLSCLGTRASLFAHRPCTLYSQSMKTVADAMEATGTDRFICVNSWSTKFTLGSPIVIEFFSRPFYLRNVLSDMAKMEDYLKYSCDHLNYTVVRAPGLSNGPSADQKIKAKEGQFLRNVSLSMPRRDVAKFMLSCLKTPEWDRKCVAIGI